MNFIVCKLRRWIFNKRHEHLLPTFLLRYEVYTYGKLTLRWTQRPYLDFLRKLRKFWFDHNIDRNRQLDERTHGQTDRRTEQRMDRKTDIQTQRQEDMHRKIEINTKLKTLNSIQQYCSHSDLIMTCIFYEKSKSKTFLMKQRKSEVSLVVLR